MGEWVGDIVIGSKGEKIERERMIERNVIEWVRVLLTDWVSESGEKHCKWEWASESEEKRVNNWESVSARESVCEWVRFEYEWMTEWVYEGLSDWVNLSEWRID